ncbi:hypothetical protein [Streptosporangium sp. NPDC002524]|uniref:hypothetical protein n=1 Tax=Streptosporangium sp. NPDC002524 TaxID=3154537 RepID=UPI0033183DE8
MATGTRQRDRGTAAAPRDVLGATAQATLAVAAAATVGDMVDLPAYWAITGALVGGVGGVVSDARHASAPALMYRLGCWCGAGGWLTYALHDTPWRLNTWAALGVGALAAAVLAPFAHRDDRRIRAATESGALVLRSNSDLARNWEARIQRVASMRVQIQEVERWANGAGYSLLAELPWGGATRARLAAFEQGLASDARLREGCGVEVDRGRHRGSAWLHVSTINLLSETIDYPSDYAPRSINEPVYLGGYRDSKAASVPLRELAGLIIGQRGSGKTSLLHGITAGVGLCTDTVVLHIDLNGGGMSQPWLDAWLEGEINRPPLGWAASNLDEALLLSEVMLAIAKDRKKSTRRVKKKANATLLPVSADLPYYLIMVDESAEAMSPTSRDPRVAQLRENLEEIQRIGRNEAVNVIFSGLRATSDVVSPNVKKQAAFRVGMFVQDEEELSYLFGWNKGISVEDLDGVGCGFVQFDKGRPRPFKVGFLKPLQIGQVGAVISGRRTGFDPRAVAVARAVTGTAFDDRFDRMRVDFADLDDDDVDDVPALPAASVAGALPRRPFTLIAGGGSATADWGDPRDIAAQAAASSPSADARTPLAPAAVPEVIARALAVFDQLGDDRIHSKTLAAALHTTQQELAAALRPYSVTTLPNKFVRNGEDLRGYARSTLQAAADRYRRSGGDTLVLVGAASPTTPPDDLPHPPPGETSSPNVSPGGGEQQP